MANHKPDKPSGTHPTQSVPSVLPDGKVPQPCPECKCLVHPDFYDQHMDVMHGSRSVIMKKLPKDCTFCGLSVHPDYLEQHMTKMHYDRL